MKRLVIATLVVVSSVFAHAETAEVICVDPITVEEVGNIPAVVAKLNQKLSLITVKSVSTMTVIRNATVCVSILR